MWGWRSLPIEILSSWEKSIISALLSSSRSFRKGRNRTNRRHFTVDLSLVNSAADHPVMTVCLDISNRISLISINGEALSGEKQRTRAEETIEMAVEKTIYRCKFEEKKSTRPEVFISPAWRWRMSRADEEMWLSKANICDLIFLSFSLCVCLSFPLFLSPCVYNKNTVETWTNNDKTPCSIQNETNLLWCNWQLYWLLLPSHI